MARLERVSVRWSATGGLVSDLNTVIQLVKEYERGDVPRVEWQDSLAFRQIEKIHAVRISSGMTGKRDSANLLFTGPE